MPYGALIPSRYELAPPMLPRIDNPPPRPSALSARKLTPNMKRFATRRAVVTGAGPEKIPERLRLAAASEKLRLVPHSWHRVALMPTREPHAGHSLGRGGWPPPPKNPRAAFFHLSMRHCH